MDRNKKLIEELRTTAKNKDKDYLKNINYNKSPQFIDLES
jgi:poly-D-alanine transfer protein DltD